MTEDDEQTPGLDYRSEPLAALLDVFALWSSGDFMNSLARRVGYDLDPTSIVAITVLARDGAIRPSDLAERLHVGASAVSKIAARLGAETLVEKTADPDDARATLLRLTEHGRDVVASLIDTGDAMMADLLSDWSADERARFTSLLERFRDDASAFAQSLQPPARSASDSTHPDPEPDPDPELKEDKK
ncbi:MarR family winged helix-turn-helix transcriptional regulator [Leifsonia poae]|uniref:MarR family winged helix-turn-helix transcriptional regulator n=1 Tax=Leifsonia poae TaxID=110933 RepID=UPI001CBD4759|nr:MarR family transcriptional regulator [Leifsonia poae]